MKRNSIACPGTTHSTFCLNCKSNLLSPPLQHQIASAGPPGFMGTTGLCPSEVPWAKPRLVLCFQDRSRGQEDQLQIQPENKTTDRQKQRTKKSRGQEVVLHCILSFHSPSLTLDIMFLLSAAGISATKTKMEMTDFFPLTLTAWGYLTPYIGLVL